MDACKPPVLEDLATLSGIEPEYRDSWGNHRVIGDETKRAILEAMGFPVASEAELEQVSLRLIERRETAVGPPVLVETLGTVPKYLSFRLPLSGEEPVPFRVSVTIRDEADRSELTVYEAHQIVRLETFRHRNRDYAAFGVPFPPGLTQGYYRLKIDITSGSNTHEHTMWLILCPERAYAPPMLRQGKRTAGLSVALYGLRSERNWGVGDLTDLKHLVDWVRDRLGGAVIGVNPLHALHNRRPYNVSPYLPLSPNYFNHIYLDMEAVPDLAVSAEARSLLGDPETQSVLNRLRNSEFVQYEEVSRIKYRFLDLAFECFETLPDDHPRKQDFARFVEREGEPLMHFALYMALSAHFEQRTPPIWVWQEWSHEFRHPEGTGSRQFLHENPEKVRFYQYTQWEFLRQLREVEAHARERGLLLGIYHDFPLAMDRCGCESWAYPDHYVDGVRVGAPPDGFSPLGQDWGFMPFAKDELRNSGYRHLIRQLRTNCRPDSALRIDHVMRFFHLFWIPSGKTPAEGAYVSDYSEDLTKILCLESLRNRTLLIGEDLGTVPGEIRETLARRGVLACRLLMFEKDESGVFRPAGCYPEQAVVSFSTHDLPTLEGFFKGNDIEIRRELNLFPDKGAYEQAWLHRREDRRRLVDLLEKEGFLSKDYDREQAPSGPDEEMYWAVMGFLANTPCRLFLLSQEDVFRDERQQNVPGTTSERRNWSNKMKYRLDELNSPRIEALSGRLRDILDRSGRTI
ncbi:MAG: 4-alpha-glucanotransferase [Deltaproteobacteria bacterium]|nr:4-alpha-glucanotransferase [Deltaproteobacteria bacterium]